MGGSPADHTYDCKRHETVEESGLKEGDKITVKLLEIDQKTGKYKLSHKVLIPKPEGYVERERRPHPTRNGNMAGGNGNGRRERSFDRPNRHNDHRNAEGGNNANRGPRDNHFSDYHDPLAEREPSDFNDSLDHIDLDF